MKSAAELTLVLEQLVKKRTGIVEWRDAREQSWFGLKRSAFGTMFLWAVFQIREGASVWEFVSIGFVTMLYVWTRKINQFWVAVGLTIGTFLTCISVLPILVGFEKTWVQIARFFAWHSAGPLILSWNTIGWVTTIVGVVSFFPYGMRTTTETIRLVRKNWAAWEERMWAKQEVLPWYESGRMLLDENSETSVGEKDLVAKELSGLSEQTINDFAQIIARVKGELPEEINAEMRRMVRRAKWRAMTDRFKRRNAR